MNLYFYYHCCPCPYFFFKKYQVSYPRFYLCPYPWLYLCFLSLERRLLHMARGIAQSEIDQNKMPCLPSVFSCCYFIFNFLIFSVLAVYDQCWIKQPGQLLRWRPSCIKSCQAGFGQLRWAQTVIYLRSFLLTLLFSQSGNISTIDLAIAAPPISFTKVLLNFVHNLISLKSDSCRKIKTRILIHVLNF